MARQLAILAVVLVVGCAGTRRVGRTDERVLPAAPAIAPAPAAPVPTPEPVASPLPAPPPPTATPPVSPPAPVREPEPPVTEAALEEKLRPALTDPAQASDRRKLFARAVVKISAELGVPISAEQALREMPCGGWSGPDCSNLTMGLEIAKLCAPVVASFHQRRTADIMTVLVEAITIHSIWHDAYGYVRRTKKKGPGYTYAGCLFSRCDPMDLKNGQVDGLLYQVGRLLGKLTGPPCGPDCSLGDL